MSEQQDKLFFRNFSLSLILISVLMVIFFITAQIVGSDKEAEMQRRAEKVAEITQPVGRVMRSGDDYAAADTAPKPSVNVVKADAHPGAEIYNGVCTNCHSMPAMAAMIPQTGDLAAWQARLDKGIEVLYDHAINGFVGELGMMPIRGGNPDLTDDEIKAAVDYMVSQVADTGDTAAATESATVAGDTAAASSSGKEIYNGLCVNCHGIPALAAMIPQTGDAAAWQARMEKGVEVLYDHAINGFVGELGMMPAKGGNAALSDAEVKAAVDYMLEQL